MKNKIVRFGVSLDSVLLEAFDQQIEGRHYTNRSEAIRDLIRRELVREEWEESDREVMGTVTMVYDHHVKGLSERLLHLQHDFTGRIVTSMHVHIDHHNCL
ncbi:nickel-responsive transcriptional regulator NikR, partial [bacterium]|nr:nickel-responsive transcriptional regulator NikR [bacterium]